MYTKTFILDPINRLTALIKIRCIENILIYKTVILKSYFIVLLFSNIYFKSFQKKIYMSEIPILQKQDTDQLK